MFRAEGTGPVLRLLFRFLPVAGTKLLLLLLFVADRAFLCIYYDFGLFVEKEVPSGPHWLGGETTQVAQVDLLTEWPGY